MELKNNSSKIILDLCGGTGAWSDPWRENGYDVRNITLPDYDVFTWEDYVDLCPNIYGILAAPPCTHFSLVRNDKTAKKPRDIPGAFKIVRACLEIIEYCMMYGKPKFWALENPVGHLRKILGKPAFTFEGYEFGAFQKKRTDLWGYFNIPQKKPIDKRLIIGDHTGSNIRLARNANIPKGYNRPAGACGKSIRRAITPRSFAWAFYRANK